MRYARAVEKLRLLADEREKIGSYPPWDEPWQRPVPEHELWDAVYGYLGLLDASVSVKG